MVTLFVFLPEILKLNKSGQDLMLEFFSGHSHYITVTLNDDMLSLLVT